MMLTDNELRALEDEYGHGTNGASELPLMRAVEAAVLRRAAAWVPCAERMPEDYVEALVFERGSTPYIAWHTVEGGGWDAGGWGERPKPTHWMPVPAPPKE